MWKTTVELVQTTDTWSVIKHTWGYHLAPNTFDLFIKYEFKEVILLCAVHMLILVIWEQLES